ncbi:MAG: hypothetical protein E7Z88_04365 [Cyanobacteria bacterium SIG27]|nr:hypothetical protein [Cyanobacteria bacterium SIG27]
MGLAASQARFLGLTARKSNVEYNVQQINQQRVALSNEVMGLYDEYNKLEVPTPPVVNDYMKTTYTLDSTYENYEIENFAKIPDGQYAGYYDVSLTWEEEVAKAYSYSARDSVITAQKGANGYSYLNFQLGTESYIYDETNPNNSTITKITSDYEKYQGLNTIMKEQGVTSGTYYMYLKNGIAYYTSEDDLDSTAFEDVNGKNVYYGTYTFDYQGSQKKPYSAKAIAALTQESNGRLSTIQIIESEDLPELVNKNYSISTKQEEDALAHEEATNNYNYQKQLYEREVDRINAKTEKLQEEDRALELQIAQLDTEHTALSTEMESVKKVIEDTMDSVFKTFNG